MQEYRRRIAYLCAYERGVQAGTAGFVKAEIRGESCRLGIHLKKYCPQGQDAGKAYIYFYHRERTVGIYLGELKSQNGALEWQGTMDPENILEKGIRFSDTGGIWVRRPGAQDYVADWEDDPVDVNRFTVYPRGGEKCIRCPRFGSCKRSVEDVSDG
ncbi:MAG: hypothetical protein K1W28_16845 [Lachnospiraceae bacterium]|mgnify:CR=1 FL=1